MNRTTTWRRAATAAAAAVTALALTAPSAGAAPASVNFSGAADALAFDLTLKTPAGLLDVVPEVKDGVLRQVISLTSSDLTSLDKVDALSTLLQGVLNKSRSTPGRETIVEIGDPAGLITASAGVMEIVANPRKDVSLSRSELANLRVGLGKLLGGTSAVQAPAPAVEELQGAVDTAVKTVDGLVGDLNTVLGDVEKIAQEATQTDVALPDLGLAELPVISAQDLLKGDLLSAKKLWSESIVRTKSDLVTANSKAGLVEVSLLGGLVRVPAFTYSSLARTNGRPGGAFADATVTTVAVQLAGDDIVKVEDDKLTVGDVSLDLADPALAGTDIPALVGQVTDILNNIIDAAGLHVAQGKVIERAAKDGSSAEAATTAFSVGLTPLHVLSSVGALGDTARELQVFLGLLPTSAKVKAAAAPVAPAPDLPRVEEPEQPLPAQSLPRTGGGLAILGALALAGGLGLRRRR